MSTTVENIHRSKKYGRRQLRSYYSFFKRQACLLCNSPMHCEMNKNHFYILFIKLIENSPNWLKRTGNSSRRLNCIFNARQTKKNSRNQHSLIELCQNEIWSIKCLEILKCKGSTEEKLRIFFYFHYHHTINNICSHIFSSVCWIIIFSTKNNGKRVCLLSKAFAVPYLCTYVTGKMVSGSTGK